MGSETTAAAVQRFASIDTLKVECVFASRDTTDRFMYITGMLSLNKRRNRDAAAFVTSRDRSRRATAVGESTAYAITILERKQTGTFAIFFGVVILALECTRVTTPTNVVRMGGEDTFPGVNAACKYRLENLFHTRSPKYAGQSFGVDVDIKPDIEIAKTDTNLNIL